MNLQAALADPATQPEAFEILRGLIERVSVHHGEDGFVIELTGEIVNMVKLTLPEDKNAASEEEAVSKTFRCSVKVVAGTCNRRNPGIVTVDV